MNNKNPKIRAFEIGPVIEILRIHYRITATLLAGFLIVLMLLIAGLVAPGVLDSNRRSHNSRVNDLEAVASR